MSQYLIERIRAQPNIDVVIGCEVSALEGDGNDLRSVRWRDRQTGTEKIREIRYLFSFIGAEPNTDWLRSSGIRLDGRGFILTDEEIGDGLLPLETSRRGVFAVGDVRACSVKRVAASVGDGAQVVAAIHKYLAGVQASQASEPAIARVAALPASV
jgi:thioredoxin reductase (NADPH)